MGSILVFLQSHEGSLPKSSLATLAAAQQLCAAWQKSGVVVLTLGESAKQAAEAVLEYGVTKSLYSEANELSKYLVSPYASAVMAAMVASGADVLVAASSSTGKDLIPRVAGALGAGQASDVLAINSDGSLKRPIFAGNVFADVVIETEIKALTVRTSAFQPAEKTKIGSALAEPLAVSFDAPQGEVVGYELSKSERPELGDATVVVSGGRALQSSENFEKYIFPLADALGAAIGASRAAVDAGYAPNDWQVGQTGKVVAPQLYISVGISGAIQHLAGMKDSKVIVAINKDSEAPIFEVADYALVADLFEVAPQLTAAVIAAKKG